MTSKIKQIREAFERAAPGPWDAESYDGGKKWWVGCHAGVLATVEHRSEEQDEANACLIALAPDMARIVLAAEALANSVSATVDEYTCKLVLDYLAAYRAAVERNQ